VGRNPNRLSCILKGYIPLAMTARKRAIQKEPIPTSELLSTLQHGSRNRIRSTTVSGLKVLERQKDHRKTER